MFLQVFKTIVADTELNLQKNVLIIVMKSEKRLKEKSHRVITAEDKDEKVRRKAKHAATSESSMTAELKNREHGGQQPAR
jgi:hypothetical protein